MLEDSLAYLAGQANEEALRKLSLKKPSNN
jgi:hypothetical protein